jgi:Fe2+ or Zn2+ uptake regulation protein
VVTRLVTRNAVAAGPISSAVDRMAPMASDLAAAEGFQPQSHRLDILGLCENCQ